MASRLGISYSGLQGHNKTQCAPACGVPPGRSVWTGAQRRRTAQANDDERARSSRGSPVAKLQPISCRQHTGQTMFFDVQP
ncbi:hypothetical protein CPSG_09688 [Coccidioides posadasii str. Silveira]|uniref:Uncharacterized protein n=1 Tax=Coccidioides posadasii (strain RMSCC 757 / Silveira) TaxID=443226 RepID=E9DIP5_COCPS|nr:hypothetical protein CPSG_09688 [Coccidioides posadasii str. Silveira]